MQQTLDRFCLDYGEKEMELKAKVRIRVLSIQWLNRHIDELEGAECTPGLIVVDEAHHAIATSYQDLFDRNRKALKLGMTATPCRMNKKSFSKLFEILLKSPCTNDFIPVSYTHLIYNGVSEPEICDYPEYFKELGIEKGKYILGMCRFVPEKNLHHLVEAYRQLIVKNKMLIEQGYKLVLAGDTDFEDEYSLGLKQMARENGVVLTGFIKGRKLHSLLTNCRCYCLPSSHEGLPIALLEAMSYGVKRCV